MLADLLRDDGYALAQILRRRPQRNDNRRSKQDIRGKCLLSHTCVVSLRRGVKRRRRGRFCPRNPRDFGDYGCDVSWDISTMVRPLS
jgi:hypothetical protein